jgi:molecular chaperone DnaK (HSP70)
LIAEADKYRQDDERRRGIRQYQNRLEGLLYNNERVVHEFGSSLDPTEREHVRGTLNRARKALTSEERSVLEEAILAVEEVAQILTEVVMVNPLAALGRELGMKIRTDDGPDTES